MSLSRHNYRATDVAGRSKTGVVEAKDEKMAARKLRNLGFSKVVFEPGTQEERKNALPTKTQFLGFLSIVLLIGICITVVPLFSPPDMKKIFEKKVSAKDEKSAETYFSNFAPIVLVTDFRGTEKTKELDDLKRELQLGREEQDTKSRYYQRSKVSKEYWEGDEYVVLVSQSTYVGNTGRFSAKKLSYSTEYRWKRFGLSWKIVATKLGKPSEDKV